MANPPEESVQRRQELAAATRKADGTAAGTPESPSELRSGGPGPKAADVSAGRLVES